MNFSPEDIVSFVEENDVKFIRLTFCDLFGTLKNLAIMPNELPRAFKSGISFDAAALTGEHKDLLLFPDAATLSVLPWRPKSGRVVRFFCDIKNPDGTPFAGDVRNELKKAIDTANRLGYNCKIGTECEFFLFDTDEDGEPTRVPHDKAGYLDIAPLDKCENVRREICLSLEEMGFNPQSSRHKYGYGQNEIDFKHSDIISAADNMAHFKSAVKTIAAQNGLYASFMPKPLKDQCGSGLHINISIRKDGKSIFSYKEEMLTDDGKWFMAGIMNRIKEITCFLNPITNSYVRFGDCLAPKYINWSYSDRSPLIRIPYDTPELSRIKVRSADAACNPYIAFKLLLEAGFEGVENKMKIIPDMEHAESNELLPLTLEEAYNLAIDSEFIKRTITAEVRETILDNIKHTLKKYYEAEDKESFEDELYFKSV